MNITEKIINYKNELPCTAELCSIAACVPHYHSKDREIIFCLEGQIKLIAGHQNVEINAGEVFSVDYRDIHYLTSDSPNLVLLFHLDLTRLDKSWDYLQQFYFSCETSHCYPYQKKAMEEVKDILLSVSYILFSEASAKNTTDGKMATNASTTMRRATSNADHARLISTSNRLIDILIRYFNWYNYNNQDEYINDELYSRFQRILKYCSENYMHKISISQLAAKEHININYFSQFVSKTVFEKFSFMLKYLRCYEAEQLLLKTDLPVAEISYKCGFSDPKYFYAAFKRFWECTPTEHRNKYREYMKLTVPESVIESSQAASILKEHITKWLLEKTLI